jgi:hypothetical protein
MAITITKEPEGIYPVFNDSYIEFSSSLAADLYAEIQLYPIATFTKVLKIYPDADGKYLLNLKEAVKVVLNDSGFEDSNYFIDAYYNDISGILLNEQIDIEVFNASTSETLTKYYDFFKAVKQIGEPIHANEFQLLTFSRDGVNNSLTYFEGFPFHFDILQVTSGNTITVKSLNTGNETSAMIPASSDSFRINIDKGGGGNWTFDNFLPLIEGLNRLEIHEDGAFRSNLNLFKKKKCSGIYLKWFNRNGGFSHYLFDSYFIDQSEGSEMGKVLNNDFSNISDATGIFKSIGKEASARYQVKAKYQPEDFENLKDIFRSPIVQMFTSQEANVEGTYIDVSVEGNISFSNKRLNNEISMIVQLPETQTAKL